MALVLPWAVPVTPLLLALPMTVLMSAREWRSIDSGGFVLMTAGRLVGTVAGVALLVLALELLPCLLGGLWASRWVVERLDERWLRPAVLAFATIAGAAFVFLGS